jgi:hypothetical protein
MDDDIGTIDQNPIAISQAFDSRRFLASSFEGTDDPLGDCTYVNVGPSARDDHKVGEGSLALKVDCDHVLGLGVIETSQNGLDKWSAPGPFRPGNRVKRRKRRFRKSRG